MTGFSDSRFLAVRVKSLNKVRGGKSQLERDGGCLLLWLAVLQSLLLGAGPVASAPDERVQQLLESVQNVRNGESFKDAAPQQPESRIGAEILEIQSPTSIRAWISPEITREEFAALEVDEGWRKNQPRESVECGPDDARFTKSPDATEDGDILIQSFYGFDWFHSATVFETDLPVGEDGLLLGFRVRKFHELTYYPGSCMVLLISPEDEIYFRVGRDADRTTDEFSIPDRWRVEPYTPSEQLIIELFGDTLVIRTDNNDSFQGPLIGLDSVL